MYFYKLKSHQDSLLVDHLKFVGDRGAILIENKSINFKYSKGQLQHTAKVMGYCHDLGKGTKYFQDYLLGKNSVKDKLKAHAFLSSLICFYNVKEINEELAIISYLCVKHHHGNLKNFVDDMYIEDSDKKFVKEQYKALEDEVNTIYNELELKLPSLEEIDDLIEKLEDILDEYNDKLEDNNDFEKYILIKFLFSILIYSDKEHAIFREKNDITYDIPSTLIDEYKIKKFGNQKPNNIRDIVYTDVIENMKKSNNRIMSITLPTGSGKTYTCMSMALKLKEKINKDMKIIYCLPFTSVIDQNYDDYQNAIKEVKKVNTVSSKDILKHHYLSPKDYRSEDLYYQGNEGRFLTENWNSQIVVTTFIQIFDTLFSNKNSNLIKFNTLSDSIVLLDEVQSIPYKYWKVINLLLKEIGDILNIYFVLITATQPLIFENNEIYELASKCEDYFKQCKRTKLIINENPLDKEEFFEYVKNIIENNPNKNILIIVNTIKLSQELYKELYKYKDEREFIYLSTSIIPKERKNRIYNIKHSKYKNIVISTQMVEAGVDIDMDIVIRDIAPLDSINQSAGRSNRENRGQYLGEVHIVKVKNNNQYLAKYVYRDDILLQATENVLKEKTIILEEDYKSLSDMYFRELKKNLSNNESNKLKELIYNLEFEDICKKFKLIEEQDKVQLFIEADDEACKVWNKYKEYLKIEDPFTRRDKLDSIKGDFYKYVITVFRNKCRENIEYGIGYVSKYQLSNTYDEEFGYKSKEEECIIF